MFEVSAMLKSLIFWVKIDWHVELFMFSFNMTKSLVFVKK